MYLPARPLNCLQLKLRHLAAVVPLCAGLMTGCSGGQVDAPSSHNSARNSGGTPPAAVHPSSGPREGTLIEFGNEEYHGEFLHDAQGVTIYLLDETARQPVSIPDQGLTLNVTVGSEGKQFQLAASPTEEDPPGRSSRFVLKDDELDTWIDAEGAKATVAVTIEGVPYRGVIEHRHDHGHTHDHDHGHE